MIDFIEKIMRLTCKAIGAGVLLVLAFLALIGCFGTTGLYIILGITAIIGGMGLIEIFKGIKKSKETPLLGDKD